MFLAGLIFISGVSISLVAAYFSIIGLATMFPGSKEAIIIMGAVLEIGKLIAAVLLHKNWHEAFGFLKYYLLTAVIVLSGITSMGIFGFLSKSHVEHGASIEKEQVMIAQIEDKIKRKNDFIKQKNDLISSLDSIKTEGRQDSSAVIERLSARIDSLKEEEVNLLSVHESKLTSLEFQEKKLNQELEDAKKPTGLFGSNSYNKTVESQQQERSLIDAEKVKALDSINSIKESFFEKITEVRSQIDSLQILPANAFKSDPRIENYRTEIENAYSEIANLEEQKFNYGSALRSLETEIGPIKYIVGALDEWTGFSVGIEQAVRIIIVILIFVFDPLAILLLIAATITYSASREDDLPPDVIEIRNKLLEELEDYLNDGGIADHFIERSKK